MNPNPFDNLASELGDSVLAVAQDMLAEVKERVSIDVQYVGGRVIRSRPGEHPRRDTGRLYGSFVAEADIEGRTATIGVSTDVWYAYRLQEGMDRPIFDAGPGGPDMLEEYEPKVLDRLAETITNP